jgi:hypothetical protein
MFKFLSMPAPQFAPETGAGGAAAAGAEGAAAAGDWTAGLDDVGRASIAKNGYKSLGDLVKGHDHFQRQIGADKIALPGKDAKPEEWNAVWDRLGRPAKAEDYKFSKPAGADWYSDDVAKSFMVAAHKAGISQAQAAAMHDWYVADVKAGWENYTQAETKRHETGRATLQQAWGASFAENLEFANRAIAGTDGLADELKALKLDSAPALAKLLAAHGRLLSGEGGLVGGGEGGGSFNLTPEQAQAKIRELNADKEHLAALQDKRHPGYQRAKETMEALYKIAYPEQAGAGA